jgi:radical SAM enzyme (TIGR01210 family)
MPDEEPIGALGDVRSISRSEVESWRGPKSAVDANRPVAVMRETEATVGVAAAALHRPELADVVSVFLTGAECALRCAMCDLWRHTLNGPTPVGALPRQLRSALDEVATARESVPPELAAEDTGRPPASRQRWIKLYNSSNFFDPRSVPREDWQAIAATVSGFDRVIVENHPLWIGHQAARFASLLDGRLEVAMGLEAADDATLRLLNKRMTLRDFATAAERLRADQIDLRVFVMLQPPGCPAERATEQVLDTLQWAQRLGTRHASVIPTRGGNGMMEKLAMEGIFVPPTATALEATLGEALRLGSEMVVTADLWDWDRLGGHCALCRAARRDRLERMNRTQRWLPSEPAVCSCPRG